MFFFSHFTGYQIVDATTTTNNDDTASDSGGESDPRCEYYLFACAHMLPTCEHIVFTRTSTHT